MKRLFSILLVIFMLFAAVSAYADVYGFVESKSLSVRVEPNEKSQKLYTVKNSAQLVITGQVGDWYVVDCYRSGLSGGEQTGYVQAGYVETSGYQIQVQGYIKIYRDPWSGKLNGERTGTFMVLYETNDWLVIQLNESTPGSGFIKKSDVYITGQTGSQGTTGTQSYYDPFQDPSTYPKGYKGTYTAETNRNYIAEWYIPNEWSVGIREYPDTDLKCLVILHQWDSVHVIKNLGEFAYVRYDDPNRLNGFVEGYVATKYWAAQ